MNPLETDFLNWYAFSPCANHSEKTSYLRNVLVSRKTVHGISISEEQENEKIGYKLSIDYYPSTLVLNEISLQQFIHHLDSLYSPQFRESCLEMDDIPIDKSMIRGEQSSITFINEQKQIPSILVLLEKVSSKNKLIHALPYSLLAFLALQIVILPGNIGSGKVGDWGYYYFIIILSGLAALTVWSYSKLFYNVRKYQHIFKLTASFDFLLVFFILSEVFLIDTFNSGINLFANSILFILVQSVGLLISVFVTAIIYFVKGGKLITFEEPKNENLPSK